MTDKLPRLLLLLGALALGAFARLALPGETAACLACHADKGHEIHFSQGGKIEAYVDEGQFKASVHGFLACTDCHDRLLTGEGHEQRRFRSEELFKLRHSSICRRCHTDGDIGHSAVHASLLEQEARGHSPVCTDCHPAHAVTPVAGGAIVSGEEAHCLGCHAGQGRTETSLAATDMRSHAHGSLSCSGCHAGYSRESHPRRDLTAGQDVRAAPDDLCQRCHFDKYTRSLEGIHYLLQSRGNPDTPGCVDCHGSHQIVQLSHDRAASAGKCGECHSTLHRIYSASVHGDAMTNAHNLDVPICTDCHKVHDINNPLAADYRDQIPGICGDCHADGAVIGKYGLSTDVVRTYLDDFHGSTLSIYLRQQPGTYQPKRPIAVCTDCHGTHDIRPISAMSAQQVKDQLVGKCRRCHERASGDFPEAWLSHYVPSLSSAPALFIVERVYLVLLPLLLLGMLLQVLLHAWRHAMGRGDAAQARPAVGARHQDEQLRRFPVARIVEHLALMLLFTALAATGLAQKFHQADAAQWLFVSLGGIDVTRTIHHCAGVALALLLALHVAVAAAGIGLRGWRVSMLVSGQDLRDAMQKLRFYLGLVSAPAACDRYDYKQKFIYWMTLAGISLMALTGFALWFPMETAGLLPASVIPLAASLHSHYVLVILLMVAVWHVYDSIFSPDVFPLNTSIFTGTMTRQRMRVLHPRELGRITGETGSAPAAEPAPPTEGSGPA